MTGAGRRWLPVVLVLLAACGDAADPGSVVKSGGRPVDRVETGALESGDDTLDGGEWVDVHDIEAEAGQKLELRLTSDDFDTYLVLLGPEDELIENDDDGLGGSSLRVQIVHPGVYRVLVTSYEPGEEGDYRLEWSLGEVEPLPEVPVLSLGSRVEGRLEEEDGWKWTGEPSDAYLFEGEAGTPVSLTLRSQEIDTYLELTFPDGTSLTNDDDWEHHDRSRIELTLPQTGTYGIWASAYGEGQTGAYTLSLQRSRQAAPPLRGAPARTFALLVGISDYGGRTTDLERTADDARKLRRGLIDRAGVAADDAVLLVDADATRDRFAAHLAALTARMTPTDQLVIFFSGHGNRVRRQAFQPADPDAVDETLTFYDGDLTDDALAELLTDVPGRLLLVFDSCFSGGFAKDVISRPGRMGVFSSEEDVTSSVAEKFEAGGYLAAFIVRALTDEWADDGDRRLTTLELSHYLHERYRVGGQGRGAGRHRVHRRPAPRPPAPGHRPRQPGADGHPVRPHRALTTHPPPSASRRPRATIRRPAGVRLSGARSVTHTSSSPCP